MLVARQRRGQARIVLISLVDVIFLLLLFFLLTTKFSDMELIELNASKAKTASGSNTGPTKLIVRLTHESAFVNDQPVAYTGLSDAVKPYLPTYGVVIKSGETATLQQMVMAIDAVKLAGGNEITLEGLE